MSCYVRGIPLTSSGKSPGKAIMTFILNQYLFFSICLSITSIIYYLRNPYHHTFIERCLWNPYNQIWRGTDPFGTTTMVAIFYTPSCQTEVGGHIGYFKGISHDIINGKPLGTGNYITFTPADTRLCDIDFPVISTQIAAAKES